MKPAVELLPVEITSKATGESYYLRIKARETGKKWQIKYIRKVHNDDKKVQGWKYRTEIQAWGMTLEGTAARMLKRLQTLDY